MKNFISIATLIFILVSGWTEAQEKITCRPGLDQLAVGSYAYWQGSAACLPSMASRPSIYIPGGSINVQVLVSGNLDLSQLSGAPGVAANLEGANIGLLADS